MKQNRCEDLRIKDVLQEVLKRPWESQRSHSLASCRPGTARRICAAGRLGTRGGGGDIPGRLQMLLRVWAAGQQRLQLARVAAECPKVTGRDGERKRWGGSSLERQRQRQAGPALTLPLCSSPRSSSGTTSCDFILLSASHTRFSLDSLYR